LKLELKSFLPPRISITTAGLDALRCSSSVIVPVTPWKPVVVAIRSRSFFSAALRSSVPARVEDSPLKVSGSCPAILSRAWNRTFAAS